MLKPYATWATESAKSCLPLYTMLGGEYISALRRDASVSLQMLGGSGLFTHHLDINLRHESYLRIVLR